MGANSSALSPESQDKTSPIYQNQTSTKKDVDSSHGNGDAKPADPENKPKCKPCCACPETKRARDACIVENGEENCQDLIEAHRECMRKEGFNI